MDQWMMDGYLWGQTMDGLALGIVVYLYLNMTVWTSTHINNRLETSISLPIIMRDLSTNVRVKEAIQDTVFHFDYHAIQCQTRNDRVA